MTVLDKFRLDGKNALVTGASRGLGRAIAVALAQAGASVALVARGEDALKETAALVEAAGATALPIPCDVGRHEEVEYACRVAESDLGEVEILVNNAGIGVPKPFEKVTLEEWQQYLAVNLTSYFLFCQKLSHGWIRRKRGKVINIASIDGLIGEKELVAYCATKGGVVQLTRALALEWSPHRVNVNAIAPGYFLTEMNRKMLEDPQIGPRLVGRIPLRRWGEAEELGPLAVYLASPASDFMTGEVVVIDGGQVVK